LRARLHPEEPAEEAREGDGNISNRGERNNVKGGYKWELLREEVGLVGIGGGRADHQKAPKGAMVPRVKKHPGGRD